MSRPEVIPTKTLNDTFVKCLIYRSHVKIHGALYEDMESKFSNQPYQFSQVNRIQPEVNIGQAEINIKRVLFERC